MVIVGHVNFSVAIKLIERQFLGYLVCGVFFFFFFLNYWVGVIEVVLLLSLCAVPGVLSSKS